MRIYIAVDIAYTIAEKWNLLLVKTLIRIVGDCLSWIKTLNVRKEESDKKNVNAQKSLQITNT